MQKVSACHGPALSAAEAQQAAFASKQPNEGPVMLSVHVAGHETTLFLGPDDYRAYLERAAKTFFAAKVRVIGYLVTPRMAIWLTNELVPLENEAHPSEGSRKALKVLQEQYSRSFNVKYCGEAAPVDSRVRSQWDKVLEFASVIGMKRRELQKLRGQARVPGELRQHGENWMAHAPKVWIAAERVGETLRMLELLPQVMGIVERAEEYPYSSLRAHLGLQSDRLVDLVRFREWLPVGSDCRQEAARA